MRGWFKQKWYTSWPASPIYVVYGGDLQGGIGELPVMGLITVRVPENFVAQARAVIADYEAAEPVKF